MPPYRLGLIGSRVDQSLSPSIYRAFFECSGIAGDYELINLAPSELARVPLLFAQGMDGLNVTAPHKIAVLQYMNELSAEARTLGAINTIVRESSASEYLLRGFNTDVGGLRQAIVRNFPDLLPGSKRIESGDCSDLALVVGLGGAARAAVASLLELGFKRIVMLGRNQAKGAEFLEDLKVGLSAGLEEFCSANQFQYQLEFVHLGESISDLLAGLHVQKIAPEMASLIVNASSIGHHEHQEPKWLNGLLRRTRAGVCDLVYSKDSRPTVFCDLAAQADLPCCDGRFMLVEQARQAFQLWTKVKDEPPFEAGLLALEAALKTRSVS